MLRMSLLLVPNAAHSRMLCVVHYSTQARIAQRTGLYSRYFSLALTRVGKDVTDVVLWWS